MMGHRVHARAAFSGTKRCKFFAPTSRDDLVPADHFYSQPEGQLDLSFVREVLQDCYAAGRPWPGRDDRSAPRQPIIKQRRPASTLKDRTEERLDQGIS